MSGELNLDYLDSYYEITMQSHKNMEQELNQNAIGAIPFIQLNLFENVRDWLNNWQFNPGFEIEIEYLIDQENAKELIRYQDEIKKDEEEYKKTIPPGVADGEEYEVEIPSFYSPFTQRTSPARREMRVNKFITDKKPDLIDKKYFGEYILLVKKVTDSFRRHSEKYVTNYFAGKYPVNAPGLLSLQQTGVKALPEPVIQVDAPKLKVNISVKKLLYFFKILIDADIIKEPEILLNLHNTIASSFSTGRADELKPEKIQKLWSEILNDPKLPEYWKDKFIDLHKLSGDYFNEFRKTNT